MNSSTTASPSRYEYSLPLASVYFEAECFDESFALLVAEDRLYERQDVDVILTVPSPQIFRGITRLGTTLCVTYSSSKPHTDMQPSAAPKGCVELIRANGCRIALNLHGNMHISEVVDGSLSVYCEGGGKTLCYDACGTVTEMHGNTTNYHAQDAIIINLTNLEVRAGNGGSMIVNFADHATIHGGPGNDTIVLGDNAVDVIIAATKGNNILIGETVHDARIYLGNGDNKVKIRALTGTSSLNMGNGRNSMNIYALEDTSSLNIGNGDNAICLCKAVSTASLNFGGGNNNMYIDKKQMPIF